MKNGLFYLVILLLFACGDPSEQQANREKLIQGLDDHKVKQVTEEQIHSAAYQVGDQIIDLLNAGSEDVQYWQSTAGQQFLDSLNTEMNHGGIKLIPEDTPAGDLTGNEKALFEAYLYSEEQGENLNQNVQSIGDQYLLYTYPVVQGKEFLGMWSLLLARKALVRDL